MFRASGRPGAMAYESFAGAADAAMAVSGPALLVLENLHWCDAASLSLAARLAESVPLVLRGLLVLSSRTEVDLGSEVERIEIGALDSSGVRRFLQADGVVERILEVTQGDPERLAALLTGRGAAPVQVERAPAAGHLLEALAVYGRAARPDHLLALAGGVGDLGTLVADLVGTGVLERTIVDGELRVGFAKGALQEKAYGALAPEHRRRLHAAVADLLTGETDLCEERAHHLLQAEAGDLAVDDVLQAGLKLEVAGEPERASGLYSRALDQVRRNDLRNALDERMSALLERTGECARAVPHAERLAASCPGDEAAVRRVARVLLGCGRIEAAAAVLQTLAEPCTERAESLLRAGDTDGARAEAEAAIQRGAEPIAARNVLGKVHLFRGELDAAEAIFLRNVSEAVSGDRAREEAGSLLNLGLVALEQGRMDLARTRYEEGLSACVRSGDKSLSALLLQNLAVLAYRQRRYSDAMRGLHEAVDALKRLGHRGHLSWLALDLGFVHLEIGEVERAKQLREFSARVAGSASVPPTRSSDLDLLAGRIAVAEGRLTEAAVLLQAALHASNPGTDRAADAALALADLALASGRPADVGAHLDSAWPPPDRLHGAFLLRRGETALALGRTADAKSVLARATSLLSRIGDPEETARAANSLARACDALGRGSEARKAREVAEQATLSASRWRPASAPEGADVPCATDEPGKAPKKAAAPPAAAQVVPATDPSPGRYGRLVGRHPLMLEMYALMDKLARSDATVLIRGESGTGKELVAEAIHLRSLRGRQRIVRVNCGALVDTLLGSELFGHEKGAFTGAHERRKGLFEVADGGTLFLDEIGDVSPRAQATLLRVLQEREFERVGGTRSQVVDLRVIGATHADLERRVAEGSFREDLYYRLKGVEIAVPALRQRKEDIPLLCEHFLAIIASERGAVPFRVAPEALDLLLAYRWPGNVRELENVLRSVSVFAEGSEIRACDLIEYTEIARPLPAPSPSVQGAAPVGDPLSRLLDEGLPLRDLQRRIEVECIARALREAGGNITQAAHRLGMKRPRLSQLIKEHGITVRKAC